MRNAILAIVAAAALLGTACQGKTNPAAPAVDQNAQAATKNSPAAAPANAEIPKPAVKDGVATTVSSHPKPASVATHAKASKTAAKAKAKSKMASKSDAVMEQDNGEGRSPGIKLSQSPATY